MQPEIILILVILFFLVIYTLIQKELANILFRKPTSEDQIKWDYICPKCGSPNWKFPNPLKGTDNIFNIPNHVNILYECSDCEFIGIFFQISHDEIKTITVRDYNPQVFESILPGYIIVPILLLIYIFVGFFFGDLVGIGLGFALIKTYDLRRKVPKS
jgi:predicted nucleic-acid-binding Zn-ribbon protein